MGLQKPLGRGQRDGEAERSLGLRVGERVDGQRDLKVEHSLRTNMGVRSEAW